MIQRVEQLPSKLEVAAFPNGEFLAQGGVQVPEAGSEEAGNDRSCRAPLISQRGTGIVIRPEILVRAERRRKGRGIDPVCLVLTARYGLGVSDQIGPAGDLVARA